MKFYSSEHGQSIIEVLVAISIGAIFIIGAATIIAPSLQVSKQTSGSQTATELASELFENARTWAGNNWNSVLSLATSSANTYHLNTSSSPFIAATGTQTVFVGAVSSTRYFYLNDVYRDSSGNVTSTTTGNNYDPSTKQITVIVSGIFNGTPTTTLVAYLTRNNSNVFDQTDWSGGSGYNGPTALVSNTFATQSGMIYGRAGSLLASPPSSTSYAYYRTITVTSTTSIASGTQTNFPMLVSSTAASWESSSTAGGAGHIQNLCTAPNGGQEPCDLTFATSSSNCANASLNFETESYTSSTGALVDWVNVPSLSAGTVIYACYDSSSITTDQSHPNATWNSNFLGVYHLSNGSEIYLNDSTGNGYNLTNNNGVTSTPGIIGTAAKFVAASSQDLTNASFTMTNASLTISFWDYMPSGNVGGTNGTAMVGASGGSLASTFQVLAPYSDGTIYWDSGERLTANYASYEGAWTYITVTTDDYTNRNIYINGTNMASTSAYDPVGPRSQLWLGYATEVGYFNGYMDEAEISNVALSPSWILTEYNNQANPGAFYGLGSETANAGSNGTINSGSGLHWAWNDLIGWIDFYNSSTVGVGASGLTGYASSSVGDISLDCATTRNGNICTSGGGSSYLYNRPITMTSNTSLASGTNSNFPLLVSSTLASWEPVSDGGHIQNLCTAPNGGQEPCDLTFATSSANCGVAPLNFETESYTSSTGALVDWVDVPSLSAGTIVYACYDSSSVTTDQSHPSSTWNSNYSSVWHLNEAANTTRKDSTGRNNLTDVHSSIGVATGLIGKNAASFTGSLSQIFTPANALGGTSSTPWTMSFWANCPVDQSQYIWSDASGGSTYNSDILFNVNETNSYLYLFDDAQNENYAGPLDMAAGVWEYYTLQFPGYGTTPYAYYNGVPYQIAYSNSYPGGFKFSQMGQRGDGTNPMDCNIDEMEYSSSTLSSQWIDTEYNNQNSPSTFYTIGSENSSGVNHQYQVLNDGNGNLSGWAWNDDIGWISFCGGESSASCPGTTNYETTIDSSGNFQGWAWNDAVGWISFNCDNNSSCGTSNYEVKTTWIPNASSSAVSSLLSSAFDTGVSSDVQFNSIGWQGAQAIGSTVQFQFAASNSSGGPWNFKGPDGTSNTYYTPSGPGTPISLNYTAFNGFRYFRYLVAITYANSTSSIVNSVIVNWSP